MSFFREEGTIIGRKYKVANKIGSGSFGVVYKGINIRSNELVAIKIESLTGKSKLLKNEAKICRHLTPCLGISSVRYYGIDQDNSYAVFDLLGVSLDTYMDRLKKFSIKTTCKLGMQMIERIEYIHKKVYYIEILNQIIFLWVKKILTFCMLLILVYQKIMLREENI